MKRRRHWRSRCVPCRWSDSPFIPLVWKPIGPKIHWHLSENPLVRKPNGIGPTTQWHWSENPLIWWPIGIGPTAYWSEHPLVRRPISIGPNVSFAPKRLNKSKRHLFMPILMTASSAASSWGSGRTLWTPSGVSQAYFKPEIAEIRAKINKILFSVYRCGSTCVRAYGTLCAWQR